MICCCPFLREILVSKPISRCCQQITWADLFWLITSILLTLIIFVILYSLIGDSMLPGGSMFGLFTIVVSSYFLGWVLTYIPYLQLPPIFGMLLAGIIIRNTQLYNIQEEIGSRVISKIRTFCIAFITLRTGLQLTTSSLRKHPFFILVLALIPCSVEMLIVSMCAKYMLHYSWSWAFLTG